MRDEKERQPERLIELQNSYAIWRVPVELLREQDKNARVMAPEKLDRLAENIKSDGILETLPLVVLKENQAGNKEFHIISGHHRTRAARKAGVLNILCLVIEREMSLSEIRSKQLSHNSLEGYDDKEVLKQLYAEIDDINMRIATGLSEQEINIETKPVSIDEVKVDLNFELVNLLFLPPQMEQLEKVVSYLTPDAKVYITNMEDFDRFAKQAREIAKRDNIVNLSAIFTRMMEIVEKYYNEIKRREDEKN